MGAPSILHELRQAIMVSEKSRTMVAQEAGISRKALYEFLESRKDPRWKTVESLAQVVGMAFSVAPKAPERLLKAAKPPRVRHPKDIKVPLMPGELPRKLATPAPVVVPFPSAVAHPHPPAAESSAPEAAPGEARVSGDSKPTVKARASKAKAKPGAKAGAKPKPSKVAKAPEKKAKPAKKAAPVVRKPAKPAPRAPAVDERQQSLF